jgi:heme exporter protein CcmD
MGGYAVFVWSSFGISALVLWLNWYIPRKQLENELRLLERRKKVKQK